MINYLTILISTIASIIVGFLWYSPFLFGKPWMKLMGFTEKKMQESKKEGMTKTYIIMIVGSLVMSYVLAIFVTSLNAATISAGMNLSFWLWLGFIAPVMLGSVLWEGKPVKLYLINVLYYLVSLFIMATIIVAWH